MGLLQVATTKLETATSSVTLTGIDSDDLYLLSLNNVAPTSDNYYLKLKFTESGTANSTSNYDYAQKFIRANSSFLTLGGENSAGVNITNHTNGTGTSETTNGIFYIYNANNSSEYTFMNTLSSNRDSSGRNYGSQGGLVFTVASSVDGVNFAYNVGNIQTGSVFSLYKVV